jgi:hypothetical protein
MFADMPLDNRTVDQVAALGRLSGPCQASWRRLRDTKRSNISSWPIVL